MEVPCHRCGHGYGDHDADGGHCEHVLGDMAAPRAGMGCPCPGFRWVDPDGPPLGYGQPPQHP